MGVQKFQFKPEGVCSKLIEISIEDDKLEDIKVMGGCNGNMQGIKALALGLPVETLVSKLKGIKCGAKSSSCPDQIALAIEEFLNNEKSNN